MLYPGTTDSTPMNDLLIATGHRVASYRYFDDFAVDLIFARPADRERIGRSFSTVSAASYADRASVAIRAVLRTGADAPVSTCPTHGIRSET